MDSGLALRAPRNDSLCYGRDNTNPTKLMTADPEVTREGVVTGPPGPARKNVMDRFIDSIEWIAAFFVGIVALNTFTAVFMRKFFAVTIPDYYNFGQFLLGILIFWGIAATSYRGTHITVDLDRKSVV